MTSQPVLVNQMVANDARLQGNNQILVLEGDTIGTNDPGWDAAYTAACQAVITLQNSMENYQHIRLATFKSSH